MCTSLSRARLIFAVAWAVWPCVGVWAQTPAPTDADALRSLLTQGVSAVGAFRCAPCPIYTLAGGQESVPVLFGTRTARTDDKAFGPGSYPPVAVALRVGMGRLVAFSEQGYLKSADTDRDGVPLVREHDNLRFALNVLGWLAGDGRGREIGFIDGHQADLRSNGGYTDFVAALGDQGYGIRGLPGTVSLPDLAQCAAVLVGFPLADFDAAELTALHDYVEQGGGLFLVGKAWSTADRPLDQHPCNQVAGVFGLEFGGGTIVDPQSCCGGDSASPLFPVQAFPAARAPRPVRVLIDLSLGCVYGYQESLMPRYLEPAGCFVAWTFNYPSASQLDRYDVLVIASSSPFAYPPSEVQAIRAFVERGGGLVLAGSGWHYHEQWWSQQVPEYPLGELAGAFGYRFTDVRAVRPCSVLPSRLTEGVAGWEADSHMDGGAVEGTLAIPPGAQVLVTDAEGQVVAAASQLGEGAVVVFGTRVIISHPSPEIQPGLTNQRLVENVFDWLSRKRSGGNTPLPDRRETLPPVALEEGQVAVHAVPPMASIARHLMDRATAIWSCLRATFGYSRSGIYHIWPQPGNPGSGASARCSDGYLIRLGALCQGDRQDAKMSAVLAHELAHTFILGRLSYLEESFASLAAYRAASSIGLADNRTRDPLIPARLEAWPREQFERLDPDGTRIDMSKPASPDLSGAAFGKGMAIIEALESRYGPDFMARYFRSLEANGTQGPLDMERVVAEMSRVAGEDLRPWFVSFGTWRGAAD